MSFLNMIGLKELGLGLGKKRTKNQKKDRKIKLVTWECFIVLTPLEVKLVFLSGGLVDRGKPLSASPYVRIGINSYC